MTYCQSEFDFVSISNFSNGTSIDNIGGDSVLTFSPEFLGMRERKQ